MATKVFETETVTLFSGKEIALRPLKISILRKFMAEFENLGEVMNDNIKSMGVIVNCVAVAMQQFDPELADDKEKLEDELDLRTAYKIIEVGAGIKLNDNDDDPNPPAAVSSGEN